MFERFTDRARRVVVLAQEEAKNLNHNYIGTEHILLGLLAEGEGVAAQALKNFTIDLDEARRRVLALVPPGGQYSGGHIPFTSRGKKVMELALREALQLGHTYIGTEHLLLAIIREGEGVGAQVMTQMGAELNRTRQQVLQLLSGYKPERAMPEDLGVFPPLSMHTCPKCPSTNISSTYREPRVNYSKVLKKVLSVGEHLRRDCKECGYSWGEACRTNLMAPNATYTAEDDLAARVKSLEEEYGTGDSVVPS